MLTKFESQELRREIEVIATGAAEILAGFFGKQVGIRTKSDKSIVTDADLRAEEFILEYLAKNRGQDAIISEETFNTRGAADVDEGQWVWIIDPLDGTSNFANNYPFFCVSVGLARKILGKIVPQAGCVGEPLWKRLYSATLGHGAWMGDRRLQVREEQDFASSFLVTGFYYHQGEELQADLKIFQKVSDQCQTIRRDGSAALDFAYAAAGVYDVFWESGLNPWDIAAGAILVEEAGGLTSNYGASPEAAFDLWSHGVVSGRKGAVAKLQSLISS